MLCCDIIESSKERKHDVEDDRWCWFNSHPLEYNPIERKQIWKEDITLNDTQRNYETLLEAIKANNISAEELLDAFTNWHGLQLIDDDFMEFLEDEEII